MKSSKTPKNVHFLVTFYRKVVRENFFRVFGNIILAKSLFRTLRFINRTKVFFSNMVLWFMAAKRPVPYGVGFGREAAKMSIFEADFGREAAKMSIFAVDFGREAANLSIFELDFGREAATCPF